MRSLKTHAVAMLAVSSIAGLAAAQTPLSSGWTYQGSLFFRGSPLSDTADFQFRLFDRAVGGAQIGSTLTFDGVGPNPPPVTVVEGLFTVELDFGYEVFDGEDRWLEIAVRTPSGVGLYTTLSPRQPVTATPYALQTRGLFVDDDLNVGIGTLSPQSALHVDGVISSTGASQVNMYHQSNSVLPSLSLDGDSFNGSRITMRESDGTIRILQRGDLGQIQLNDAENGAVRVHLESGALATEGGFVSVRNSQNNSTIVLDGDPDDPRDDGGRVSVRNASGTETVALAGSEFNGRIEVKDNNGQIDVLAESNTVLGGMIDLNNISGEQRLVLAGSQGNDQGGYIWMRQADGETGVILDAEGNGNGSGLVSVRNDSGIRETVALVGGGDNSGGNLYVRNSAGETTVELRGDENDQDSGFIGVGNRAGANDFWGIAMEGYDPFLTGARIVMHDSSGNQTIELDSQDASHGEIALWDSSGNRTFRVFGNRMTIYDNAGVATWSIDGNGAKNAIVNTPSYGQRLVYTMESPEVWFEDVGSGRMIDGAARIDLDPMFRETVTIDEQHPMKVFVTLTGDCNGVFVEKGDGYFIVRELAGGRSNAGFDYRVMAKRVGFEDTRLESFTEEPAADGDAFITPVRAEREPTVDGIVNASDDPAATGDN